MKKITLLFAVLLITPFGFGQESVHSVLSSEGANFDYSEISRSVITSNQQTRDIVGTYTSRTDFNDACDGTLTLEDFAGGPSDIEGCGPEISAAGDVCFPPGEIEDGIVVTMSGGADTVYVPTGAFGNSSAIVGANTFAEYTIINFPDDNVNSVGMDVYALTSGGTIEVRIFGESGFIDSFNVTSPTTATFFGVIADEIITSIELEDLSQVNAELVGNVEFGICDVLSVEGHLLSGISVYPNPASGILNVRVPSSIEITEVTVFDLLGRNTGVSYSNGTVNVSELSRGVYMMTIKTSVGTLTQKIVKK